MTAYKPGDKVRLLRIEESLYSGLPDESVARLRRWIGKEVNFANYAKQGVVEVEFRDVFEGEENWITIFVDPTWIERVST